MSDQTLTLRRATLADAWLVRALTRQAYAKWIPVTGREPRPMTADYDKAVAEHLVDMLYADFELAGLIEMIPEPDHLMIENVAIAPDLQGRGHGRFLLGHAEAVARTLGLPVMRLLTNQKWPQNVALYQHLGYKIDREETFEHAIGVHMSKTLRA
jgi:GNAT superfamily N-acetyltransferase